MPARPCSSGRCLRPRASPKHQAVGGTARSFDASTPLEAMVELRPVPMQRKSKIISARSAAGDGAAMARADWRPGLYSRGISNRLSASPCRTPERRADADICAHPEAWAAFQAAAGRAMDGGALFAYLPPDSAHQPCDGTGIDPLSAGLINGRAPRFPAWAARFLRQAAARGTDAWNPQGLDYQFSVSAPLAGGGETVYSADDYASAKTSLGTA